MDRLRVSVYATALISLLTLAQQSTATTQSKSTKDRRPASITTVRASSSARPRDLKTTKGCAPCAAELAQSGRSAKKGAKIGKDLPCHPKD
jgi:hypothetical protein